MFASPKTTMRTIDDSKCVRLIRVSVLRLSVLQSFFYEKGHQIGIRYIGCPS